MNAEDIKTLVDQKNLPGDPSHIDLVETHGAWILLTEKLAYKIKKPVKFSFLDFSTLEKRRYYCHRELQLNQRTAPEMYLSVLPIYRSRSTIVVDGRKGEILDYCVQMKRLDNHREMKRLLQKDLVEERDLIALAKQVSDFHARIASIHQAFDEQQLKDDFDDTLGISSSLANNCGQQAAECLVEALHFAAVFIETHASRMQWRRQHHYVKDCHGDLHSGNIFLLASPVIFDCIEFSDRLRHIDVLDEIAFLCMDLEYYGRPEYSELFKRSYLHLFPVLLNDEDERLFLFYKWYRSGIRLKVTCLRLEEEKDPEIRKRTKAEICRYFSLFQHYYLTLSGSDLVSGAGQ